MANNLASSGQRADWTLVNKTKIQKPAKMKLAHCSLLIVSLDFSQFVK